MAKEKAGKKNNQRKHPNPAPTPRSAAATFPIVGIGASAGGLEALKLFLQNVPADSGLAFVVVQHLDPTHKGIMVQLLQRATAMKVSQVKGGTRVQPDCVYVIPPNKDLSLMNGVLHLLDPVLPRAQRLPVDSFFRSLADDAAERSIGVTSYFRDPAVWEQLQAEVIPALLKDRAPHQALRVWVPGCSTGQEAYSLAIVFQEALEQLKTARRHTIQIFATDLDEDAIKTARTAVYSANIGTDVSAARRGRFFVQAGNGYKICKPIRKMVIFALHTTSVASREGGPPPLALSPSANFQSQAEQLLLRRCRDCRRACRLQSEN